MTIFKYILGIAFISVVGAFLDDKLWPIVLVDRAGTEYPHSFNGLIGSSVAFTIISLILFLIIKYLFKPSTVALVIISFVLPGIMYFIFALAFGIDFRGFLLGCLSQGTCFVIFVLIDLFSLSKFKSASGRL